MSEYVVVGLLVLIAFLAAQILDRLPKPSGHKDFSFELPDDYVVFRADNLLEQDFDVSYGDGWQVGRAFGIYGSVIESEDAKEEGALDLGKRVGVKVGPTADWFQRSRIGYVRVYPAGGCEIGIGLPYQLARHVLEEMRREPDQVVRIGYKKSEGKNGTAVYGVYSFELSTPFDRL